MMLKRYILLLTVLFALQVNAQEIKKIRDIGIWSEVAVAYQINKDWSISLEEQVRFFNNLNMFEASNTGLGAEYRINKQFKLGAQIRYSYDRKKELDLTHDIRYSLDFKYRLKITKELKLDYRLRYQNKYIDLFEFVDEHKQKAHLRHRLELGYKIKNVTVYASTELFREYAYFKKPAYNNLRFMLGTDFKTTYGKLGFALGYEYELNDPYPFEFFFLKLSYTLKLNNE